MEQPVKTFSEKLDEIKARALVLDQEMKDIFSSSIHLSPKQVKRVGEILNELEMLMAQIDTLPGGFRSPEFQEHLTGLEQATNELNELVNTL